MLLESTCPNGYSCPTFSQGKIFPLTVKNIFFWNGKHVPVGKYSISLSDCSKSSCKLLYVLLTKESINKLNIDILGSFNTDSTSVFSSISIFY